MKLDERIENESLIYTPFSNALINLHEKGYFTNDIMAFDNLKNCDYGELDDLDIDLNYPYWCKPDNGRLLDSYAFFIPESSLKPTEKKYRPFTHMEFDNKFTVGRPIKYRLKGEVGHEQYLILSGYRHTPSSGQIITYVYIGPFAYTLDELFNDFEWQEHYTEDFKPFGVEEK